ncbi:MAG: BON domain-containing protein [Lautropia sp.]
MNPRVAAPALLASALLLGACDRDDPVDVPPPSPAEVPSPSREGGGAVEPPAVELRSPVVVSPELEQAAKEKIAGAADAIGDAVSDTVVTAKVKSVLMAMDGIEGARVSVSTREGVVTLTGSLPDAAQVARAVELVSGVEGVRRVENRLKEAA